MTPDQVNNMPCHVDPPTSTELGQLGMGGRFGSAPPILSQWAVNLGFVGVLTRDYPALRDHWISAIEERRR